MADSSESSLRPRLCKLCKWPDFNGYGFNLHAEKGKAGQFIGKVDEGSPAEACGMKDGDRIVEVEGVNIGNENHQQVVGRIKAAGDRVSLLLVDTETDDHYKSIKEVIQGDSNDVLVLSVTPRDIVTEEEPSKEEPPEPEPVPDIIAEPEPQVEVPDYTEQEPEPEPEILPVPVENGDRIEENSTNEIVGIVTSSDSITHHPRLCHIVKWPDFVGYGFNLHAERDKVGQYIGQIDEGSPAEIAHLKEKDRIIEVNGVNIEKDSHQKVIEHIKSGGDETRLLVVDPEADKYYKERGISVYGSMSEVEYHKTPSRSTPEIEIEEPAVITSTTHDEIQGQDTEVHVNEIVTNDSYEPEQEDTVIRDIDYAIKDTDELEPDMLIANQSYEPIEVNVEQNGIQSVPVVPEPTPAPEPVKAPAPSKPAEPVNNNISSDPFSMSAAEMRAKLQSKKRNDPRIQRVDMTTKKQLFEKL